MIRKHFFRFGAALVVSGATVGAVLVKPEPIAANGETNVVSAVTAIAPTMLTGARAEIQSQTGTTLSMKFFDASEAQYTLDFTRPTTNDVWKATTSEPVGIVFGNDDPQYAGPSARRSFGITREQSIQTFSTAIASRPFDNVTIFRTFGGMAIGLWQQGLITEIWYVGTFVQEALQVAQDPDPDGSMCEAVRLMCCATTNDVPNPNMEACAAALACPAEVAATCGCLDAICDMCHPAPQPPAPACTAEQQALSDSACILGAPACQPPPPPIPDWVQDVIDLLQEIIDRLQEIIDNLPMN